jgi:hypothetical protein
MQETGSAALRLLRLLQHLPRAQHAVAYGSGVFHQPDLYAPGDGDGPMIDFILAVDDPVQWHRQVRCRRPGAAPVQQPGAAKQPHTSRSGRAGFLSAVAAAACRISSRTPATTRSWSGWAPLRWVAAGLHCIVLALPARREAQPPWVAAAVAGGPPKGLSPWLPRAGGSPGHRGGRGGVLQHPGAAGGPGGRARMPRTHAAEAAPGRACISTASDPRPPGAHIRLHLATAPRRWPLLNAARPTAAARAGGQVRRGVHRRPGGRPADLEAPLRGWQAAQAGAHAGAAAGGAAGQRAQPGSRPGHGPAAVRPALHPDGAQPCRRPAPGRSPAARSPAAQRGAPGLLLRRRRRRQAQEVLQRRARPLAGP